MSKISLVSALVADTLLLGAWYLEIFLECLYRDFSGIILGGEEFELRRLSLT